MVRASDDSERSVPRVAILSTGDELCRADEAPQGRIVDTNAPSLALAVLFLLLQRHFIEGIALSGSKA